VVSAEWLPGVPAQARGPALIRAFSKEPGRGGADTAGRYRFRTTTPLPTAKQLEKKNSTPDEQTYTIENMLKFFPGDMWACSFLVASVI